LPPTFVTNLKKEYAGTVYYDRYILGKWSAGEGAIYRIFIENKDEFIRDTKELPKFDFIFVGVDPGGNKSNHAMVATGINASDGVAVVLRSHLMPAKGTSPEELFKAIEDFVAEVGKDFETAVDALYFDNEAQTLLNGLKSRATFPVFPCVKGKVNDRILATISLMNRRKLVIRAKKCDSLITAWETAVWDPKALVDRRLDDGTSDIDSLDAFEYSISAHLRYLVRQQKDE
jgi:hypothetical protein